MIMTPIKGVVSHPAATFSHSKFNHFKKSPVIIRLEQDLKLSSMVFVVVCYSYILT